MDDDFSSFVRTESSFKGTSEANLERMLTVEEETDENGNRKITESADYKKAWEEYEKKVEKAYGGNVGFKALKSKRVQDRGYRTARFVPEGKVKAETEALGRMGDKNRTKPTTIWGALKESRAESKMKKKATKQAGKKADKKKSHKPGTIFGKRK